MVRITEAIFTDGVLKPVEKLDLRDQQRVRITIETSDVESQNRHRDAVERFRAGREVTNFCSAESYPTRDELHERR